MTEGSHTVSVELQGLMTTLAVGQLIVGGAGVASIASVEPIRASSSAGTSLTISGTNLEATSSVSLVPLARSRVPEVHGVNPSRRLLQAGPRAEAALNDTASFTCSNVSPSSTTVVCDIASAPVGGFGVQLTLEDGTRILANRTGASISLDIEITSVSPSFGSVAGGTKVTITGFGFSKSAARNAVFMTVPTSSRFPNGIVACDVMNATETTIVCQTRAHCTADASASDPSASRCRYEPTDDASAVSVTVCPLTMKDSLGATVLGVDEVGKLRCWGDDGIPESACRGEQCSFGYSSYSVFRVSARRFRPSKHYHRWLRPSNRPCDISSRWRAVRTIKCQRDIDCVRPAECPCSWKLSGSRLEREHGRQSAERGDVPQHGRYLQRHAELRLLAGWTDCHNHAKWRASVGQACSHDRGSRLPGDSFQQHRSGVHRACCRGGSLR